MNRRKIDMHRLQDLVRLHRMGVDCREVARLLKMSPNTERVYRNALKSAGLLMGDPEDLPELGMLKEAVNEHKPIKHAPQQVSSIVNWESAIKEMFENEASPKAIYDCLKLQHKNFSGTYPAVKRMVRRLIKERGVRAEDVVIPVDTKPGEVAQVDFGYVGRLYDPALGTLRKAWVFVMVLGYSRHMSAQIVFDQRSTTWLELHMAAFAKFGGVPRTLVPDNLKSAVIRAAYGIDEATCLNRSYREFARHYGFKIDPTPVRAPKKKGKVESGVKYVKNNFFRPRGEMSIEDANRELELWVTEIAGQRIHGTTGRRPLKVFEEDEYQTLIPLPRVPFELVEWKVTKVKTDCHVLFDRRMYSVPWRLVGQEVWIRATPSTVCVFHHDDRIATHERRDKSLRSTIDGHLPEHRADWRHRDREYWEERARKIGPVVGEYISEVFDSDEVLSMLRVVQSIVTHLEGFAPERAQGACARARHFGNYSYVSIKAILKNGLDQDLPQQTSVPAPLITPRFARSIDELVSETKENHCASN